jgi:hypothetical protein
VHFTLDRSALGIAVLVVVLAIVLLYMGLVGPPKIPADVWPNVSQLFN